MFGLNTSSTSAVDPEQERDPPPPPTLVYFPQNDLDEHNFQTDEAWTKHLPDLFKQYSRISKPADVTVENIRSLNISVKSDVELGELIPVARDGHDFLPPSLDSRRESMQKSPRSSLSTASPSHKHPLLSNGHKAPDEEVYARYAREMMCENDDALRVLQKKKPRPGQSAPQISHFRKFWSQLELVSNYWDTSLDHYYEAGTEPSSKPTAPKSPKGLKRLSLALSGKDSLADAQKPATGQRYKGRRISTGSKMPDQFRVDLLRHLIEPISWAFGCISMNPKKVPQMEIATLRLPVTQTAVIWRNSQDKASSKRGITEGPLLGCQCRGETGFVRDKKTASLDAAREIAGLLLLAEERAREGKPATTPGQEQWWTSKPRWGGGPGGEFGEAEGNKDHPSPPQRSRAPIQMPTGPTQRSSTEEDIWKELKPGPSLYDPHHTYLAIGKDRAQPFDNVYMISCLFHHIAILKLTVHPLYVDFLVSGKGPAKTPDNVPWYKPKVERTRWYDLLDTKERSEAFRGLWGLMSYLMRLGDDFSSSYGQRQKSDSHQHHFSFRRKSLDITPAPSSHQRANSVAF